MPADYLDLRRTYTRLPDLARVRAYQQAEARRRAETAQVDRYEAYEGAVVVQEGRRTWEALTAAQRPRS